MDEQEKVQPQNVLRKKANGAQLVIAIFTAIAIIYVAYSLHWFSDGQQPTQPSSLPTIAPNAQPIKVLANQLVGDYGENQIAADNKYKGQLLQISGLVDSVGKDVQGNPFVVIKTNLQSFSAVDCFFSQSQEGQLASLMSGDAIIAQGMESNYLAGNVEVKSCSLVQVGSGQ